MEESMRVGKKMDSTFAFISHSVATFPNQQPKIDNAQLARRKRRRTSPTELSILEQEFQVNSRPDRARREYIALRVGMSEKAVQIWFQNKRQSFRKKYGYGPTILAGGNHSEQVVGSGRITTTFVDTELSLNQTVMYGQPSAPCLGTQLSTQIGSQMHQDFQIYEDGPEGAARKAKSLRLSMSEEDGKAVLVSLKKSPKKDSSAGNNENKENKENPGPLLGSKLVNANVGSNGPVRVLKPMSPSRRNHNTMSITSLISSDTSSPVKQTASPRGKDQREAECISNLLSLRSGVWA